MTASNHRPPRNESPRRGELSRRGKLSRRAVLKGIGGTVVALPLLESLGGRRLATADDHVEPFAIFFRQANGVAQATGSALGDEPERFSGRSPRRA